MNTYKHEMIVSVGPTGTTVAFTWIPDGYVEVGRHTIEGAFDQNKVAPELVKKLKEGLAESDAEHQKKRNAILDQIGKLEAIGHEVEYVPVQDWYFTFGNGHLHPFGYVKIAGTFQSARDQMMRIYGTEWAFQYSKEEFGDQDVRFQLHEVNIDDEIPF